MSPSELQALVRAERMRVPFLFLRDGGGDQRLVRLDEDRLVIGRMPGSEQALRHYIDALSRGEPNYDDMTPEVAADTRQQLLLNQAILAKLGALRAMSFRSVTPLDSDVYFVHFANGSAEWRIGLARQGRIGRIALGPQY